MQPDSMLTTYQMIHDSANDVRKHFRESWAAFIKSEPELGQFIMSEAMQICGKLAFSGAGPLVLRGVHEDMRRLTLTALMATRRGQYELWKETISGSRLAVLWQSVERTDHEDGSDIAPPLKADWHEEGP